MQRLLNFSPWDEDAARDALARHVARRMGDPAAVLAVDETGFLKKGCRPASPACTPCGRDAAADGFQATTGMLPAGLQDALVAGHVEPLAFRVDLPVKPREAYLDRTDPNVAAIARDVLESALDSVSPADSRDRPARRCGVMRTAAVTKRTTLLLVRYRFHLELPGRDGPRQLVAEDAQVVAYRGAVGAAEWLSPAEVAALLTAVPSGNVPPDQAADFAERAVGALDAVRPYLDSVADSLAITLRDDHIRVREAGGQRVRRQIAVRAQKPCDVLRVYVYLPGGGLS